NAILGLVLRAGATAVLVDRFEPRDALDVIARHRITLLGGAPPMYAAWLASMGPEGPVPELASVRLAVSGAAPLPPDVFTAFRDRVGVTIWEGYGLTECAPAVTSNGVGEEAKPGSIGLPLPGVEVRLLDEPGVEV